MRPLTNASVLSAAIVVLLLTAAPPAVPQQPPAAPASPAQPAFRSGGFSATVLSAALDRSTGRIAVELLVRNESNDPLLIAAIDGQEQKASLQSGGQYYALSMIGFPACSARPNTNDAADCLKNTPPDQYVNADPGGSVLVGINYFPEGAPKPSNADAISFTLRLMVRRAAAAQSGLAAQAAGGNQNLAAHLVQLSFPLIPLSASGGNPL